MDIDSDIDARLSTASSQPQRERVEGYLSLLAELLTTKPVPVQALVKFGLHFTTSTTMAMVVGSRVLDALVASLCAGLQLEVEITDNGDRAKWTELGKQAFDGEYTAVAVFSMPILDSADFRRGGRGGAQSSHRGCAGARPRGMVRGADHDTATRAQPDPAERGRLAWSR